MAFRRPLGQPFWIPTLNILAVDYSNVLSPQFDYPLPPLPVGFFQVPELQLGINLCLYGPTPAARPSNQLVWPRPLIYAVRQDITWAINPSPALLLTPTVTPGVLPPQFDYPLPPDVPRIVSGRTWIQGGILAVPAAPFSQDDWPAPKRITQVVFSPAVGTFVPLLTSVQPFAQDDWPVPKLPLQTLVYAEAKSVFGPLLRSIQPFSQDDWPVPIRPPIVRAEAQRADIGTLHSIQPPTNLEDWP